MNHIITLRLEHTKDRVAGESLRAADTVSVTEEDTNLRRLQALLGQLEDLLL